MNGIDPRRLAEHGDELLERTEDAVGNALVALALVVDEHDARRLLKLARFLVGKLDDLHEDILERDLLVDIVVDLVLRVVGGVVDELLGLRAVALDRAQRVGLGLRQLLDIVRAGREVVDHDFVCSDDLSVLGHGFLLG